MLQIKRISKQYKTGDLVQRALNEVSLNLRDNEFVAILGPSGSGKTTLLNIIGGLDRYDSGDVIINSISTKRYKDRDWDSYRNHTIGFVFQSYNLIPHQSILSNVELALTISGISRRERKNRAKQALVDVGLGDQLHKKPTQMSGGQMQRVAIARALVNNPDILLADEPTGALDTETSVQVMELLKEVAKDRLVVMVTHNPELAQTYATRIVRLQDGKITADSDPFEPENLGAEPVQYKNLGKASMSFWTALSLSFNNLRTKKARTFLTAFAGSIGIIGIALILSLSNGVNKYIEDIQKDTMTSYPIQIQAQTVDLSKIVSSGQQMGTDQAPTHALDGIYSNSSSLQMASSMVNSITTNNLTAFKKYLDDPNSEIHQFIGENGILYSYDVRFGVYTYDPEDVFMRAEDTMLPMAGSESAGSMPGMSMMMSNMPGNFEEILPGKNGELIAPAIHAKFSLEYGNWPANYDEIILVLNKNHEISTTVLYQLGLLPSAEYQELMGKLQAGEEIELQTHRWSYEEICNKEFYLIPACDAYLENENGTFRYVGKDLLEMEKLLDQAIKLKIVGVITPAEDAASTLHNGTVGYTRALTDYLIQYTEESPVVKAQKASQNISVLNGMTFAPEDDSVKIEDTKQYLSKLGVSDKAKMYMAIMQGAIASNPQLGGQLAAMGEVQLAAMLDQYLLDPQDEVLLAIYDAYISAGTYDENMKAFGLVSLDAPAAINLYADSFEAKDQISDCIERYNRSAQEENQIVYTDYVGLLMSSITTIIDVISYVLIAFVSVSLVVSSIMIGIITYISVLERTKEIGILRAIGASKSNISQVFNAETFIIGLISGLLGIGVSLLTLIPGNMIIHSLVGNEDISAVLAPQNAVVLVILSVILTLIGGLIPAKKAARKDPVAALRSE